MDPSASVIISTKNRKDELRNALASILRQTVEAEIVVFDDGSTDGTSEMVARQFPQARLARAEQSLGIIGARNQAIAMARANIVITIDDDCVFPTPRIIEQTLADFDHPRIGAVAIPSVDVLYSPNVIGRAPDAQRRYITSQFRGGANAMRRDIFLKLGSYRACLFRQGEEDDYGLRLLDAGYVVRLGRSEPIHHLESPMRDRGGIFYHNVRSRLLVLWHNSPTPLLPLHLVGAVVNRICRCVRQGYWLATLNGIGAGLAGIARQRGQRRPVAWRTHALWQRLRDQVLDLEAVLPELPPLRE